MVGPDADQEREAGKSFTDSYTQSSLGRTQCTIQDHWGKQQGGSQQREKVKLGQSRYYGFHGKGHGRHEKQI